MFAEVGSGSGVDNAVLLRQATCDESSKLPSWHFFVALVFGRLGHVRAMCPTVLQMMHTLVSVRAVVFAAATATAVYLGEAPAFLCSHKFDFERVVTKSVRFRSYWLARTGRSSGLACITMFSGIKGADAPGRFLTAMK